MVVRVPNRARKTAVAVKPCKTFGAETFEARTTRKGGKHDPQKLCVMEHSFTPIRWMEFKWIDNQKVRKLGKDLKASPLEIKTGVNLYEDQFYDELDKKIEQRKRN